MAVFGEENCVFTQKSYERILGGYRKLYARRRRIKDNCKKHLRIIWNCLYLQDIDAGHATMTARCASNRKQLPT